jgi:hypothetical protein
MFVQSYRLGDIHGRAGPPDPRLARRLMEETQRFYPSGSPHATSGTQRASVIGR